MKRILLWILLTALLLPGMAMGAEEETGPIEVFSPGFVYHTLDIEAAGLVSLRHNHAAVAGGYFVLEEGFLSLGYEQVDDFTISVLPTGQPLTCWNSDMSPRWTLEDERLAGAWYTELLELEDGLLLGSERGVPGIDGQAPSLLMLDKETGDVRWQLEGVSGNVWIPDFQLAADGNILVASNGELQGEVGDTGTLTLVDAAEGKVLWTAAYLETYGVKRLRSVCRLGDDGLLLYGLREENDIVLYTDSRGGVRAWFTFQTGQDTYGYTSLRLMQVSEDVAYLRGWELVTTLDRSADLPYNPRTLCLMRIDTETFAPEKKWWGNE